MSDSNVEVDNLDRLDAFLSDFPAGSGYQGIIYYGQVVAAEGRLPRYDFGGIKNNQLYGSVEAPEVPLD